MASELSGLSLGQYKIIEQIDDTGIIHAYRAIQQSLDREVAVHVVAPEYRNGSVWQKALINGAKMAAKYEHANIVPVFDYGVQDGIDYVALRLITGGTVYERMQREEFQVQQVVIAVNQIANALDYVHAMGKYHGDIASINIIFDQWGSAYIAEFYLAGMLDATAPEQMAGVPNFMAPERMLTQPPTPFTDQYSLAAVAYYVLTGQLPWERMAPMRSPDSIKRPQEHRPEIPEAVNDVLFRALATLPEDRYPTVMDFARQFEQALQAADQYVFISYSRRDTEYSRQLRDHLIDNGLPVWIDDQIEHGAQWFNQIDEAIKGCSAFLIIMSPDSGESEWVQKEILLAKRYKKPIFPLLLRGQEFPLLIDIQFADVLDGGMPNIEFYRRVSQVIFGR